MKTPALLLLALLFLPLSACGARTEDRTTPTAAATPSPPSPASQIPPSSMTDSGYRGDIEIPGPRGYPAEPDANGPWYAFESFGVTVEVPDGPEWRLQGLRDPCFADFRSILLLERVPDGARIRVDVATKRVISTSPEALAAIIERIQRSFSGQHMLPEAIRTLAAGRSVTPCAGEDDAVPTLSP